MRDDTVEIEDIYQAVLEWFQYAFMNLVLVQAALLARGGFTRAKLGDSVLDHAYHHSLEADFARCCAVVHARRVAQEDARARWLCRD